jgi:hypothetical protein
MASLRPPRKRVTRDQVLKILEGKHHDKRDREVRRKAALRKLIELGISNEDGSLTDNYR